jgi:XRE family transcriptional regulator, master regulator for biofilm formation
MAQKQGCGAVLKKLREDKGLTQVQLAKKTGVTQEYIAMIESGVRKNPTIDVLKRLAKSLDVKVADLLE